MKLSELVAETDASRPETDPEVFDVVLDSRRVRPGAVYVGLPGTRHHGAHFAKEAAAAGAVALITDPQGAKIVSGISIPVCIADDPREVMGVAAARIHGHPSRSMGTFAVTGTNGKSTTVFMIDAALRAAGRHVGVIGTLGFLVDGQPIDVETTTITTPESPDLQQNLVRMREAGVQDMAMEVSSHALVLGRVSGMHFDIAGFTNLGRDHLDFHHTVEQYFEAKAKLFTSQLCRCAVITIDDDPGRRMARRALDAGLGVSTVGFAEDADYRIVSHRPEATGSVMQLAHPRGLLEVNVGLPGVHNLSDAALALAMIDQGDVDITVAASGLADVVIPGRMQPVPLGDDAPRVYVDFAHTPQAISSALEALNYAQRAGRVIVVLGAGGDRDPDKREPMGAAAARLADVVVVTDDNPRSEEPAAIRARVLAGARSVEGRAVQVVDGGDRRSAIEMALRIAERADVVAILGKGHEKTQQLADCTINFDDVAEIVSAWERGQA